MDVESEESFTDMLQSLVLERSSIPNAIARGVDAWMKTEKALDNSEINDYGDEIDTDDDQQQQQDDERTRRLQEMEDALYRFFTARVGLRFLTEHHILSSPARVANQVYDSFHVNKDDGGSGVESDKMKSFLGCIEPDCCPSREVRNVAEAIWKQTVDYYGDGLCPEIQIIDGDIASQQQKKRKQGKNNFTYVPHHLRYMVGELLKNSCRATIKR